MRRGSPIPTMPVRKWSALCVIGFAWVLPLFLVSCGSQSDATYNLTGTWNIQYTTTGGAGQQGPFRFSFTQSDTTLGGVTSQGTVITGTVSGTDVAFTFSWTDPYSNESSTYAFLGTVGSNGTTMSGQWNSATGQTGAWNGQLVVLPAS